MTLEANGASARFSFTVALAIAACLGGIAGSACAQTWSAAADLSTTSNPNGAWSYGWKQTAAGAFQIFTVPSGCAGVQGWSDGSPLSLGKNVGSGPTCCATWSAPGGAGYFHPGGSGERSTWRWTAPGAGSFAVSVGYAGMDYVYPTSTDVSVDVNGATVHLGFVNSYSAGTACVSNTWTPSGSYQGTHVLAAGDHVDVSVGPNGSYYGDATLVSIVITGSNSASATPVGAGCSASAPAPTLACSPPVIGANVTLSIANATPLKSGALYASAPPAAPLSLGGGCSVYLDVGSYFALISPIATNVSGTWSTTVTVPYDPGLIGFTLALQGALFGTAAPLGVDLTNGVLIVVGL